MSVIDEKVAELTEMIDVTALERMNYRLSDAIREGCMVTDKAEGWEQDGNMCAMSAAIVAARARGYMK